MISHRQGSGSRLGAAFSITCFALTRDREARDAFFVVLATVSTVVAVALTMQPHIEGHSTQYVGAILVGLSAAATTCVLFTKRRLQALTLIASLIVFRLVVAGLLKILA